MSDRELCPHCNEEIDDCDLVETRTGFAHQECYQDYLADQADYHYEIWRERS